MFADCHLHLLAYARSLTELDLGAPDCPTIPDVLARLRQVPVRHGGWVVARGFYDALASPPRLLERAELDRALPETPVRVRHRTGHASLLNSAALAALPPLPAGASLALDQSEQAVLLVGAESWLDSITGRPERAELIRGLRQADVELGRVLLRPQVRADTPGPPRSAGWHPKPARCVISRIQAERLAAVGSVVVANRLDCQSL